MKIHEFAKIFPDMKPEEFNELKADIEKNGQINPIITFKGEVIDGKNRLKALNELNIEPDSKEYKGNPENIIPYVISQNLQRRHMDSSQRAAASLKCLELLEAEAKKRQGQRNDLKPEEIPPIKGPSAEQAAKMFRTNKEYVKGAKKIKEKAPELLKEIESGEKTVPQAVKEVKEKEEVQAADDRNGYKTLRAFNRLYTSKHGNRAFAIHASSEKVQENIASILKSYKTHNDDLKTILLKFQTNGDGQPNTDYQDIIKESKELIYFLRKIILLYEAADESVQFYADNRDTLNKTYEKEAKWIVKDFKPIWKIDYYDDQGEVKHSSNSLDTEDINKVESAIMARIPDDTCTRAVANVVSRMPAWLNSFHIKYVDIKEFNYDPIELLPDDGETYLKKPSSEKKVKDNPLEKVTSQ